MTCKVGGKDCAPLTSAVTGVFPAALIKLNAGITNESVTVLGGIEQKDSEIVDVNWCLNVQGTEICT